MHEKIRVAKRVNVKRIETFKIDFLEQICLCPSDSLCHHLKMPGTRRTRNFFEQNFLCPSASLCYHSKMPGTRRTRIFFEDIFSVSLASLCIHSKKPGTRRTRNFFGRYIFCVFGFPLSSL